MQASLRSWFGVPVCLWIFLMAIGRLAAVAQTPSHSVDPSSFPSVQADITESIPVKRGWGTWNWVEEGEGHLWVCTDSGKWFRVDTNTSPAKLIPLDFKKIDSFAAGFGSLWVTVARGANHGLHRLDPKTKQEVGKIPINGNISVFIIADGSVWVSDGKLLYRVDPKTNQVTAKILVDRKSGVAGEWKPYIIPAMGSVWVLYRDGTLCQFDPASNLPVAEIRVGPPHLERFVDFTVDRYAGLAFGEGSAWITESKGQGNLNRVDLKTNQVVATIPVGNMPQTAVVGGGFVWVSIYNTNVLGHFVLKIDPRTNQIIGKIFFHSTIPYLSAQSDGILAWAEGIGFRGPGYWIWKILY
jgi:hypothetical protein